MTEAIAVSRASASARAQGTSLRLFVTVWLIVSMHATTNIVRETYLAIALGGYGTVRVDRYAGLHPDLFTIPGRGTYINNNPGASILGAAAYAVIHPIIGMAVRMRPSIAAPKPPVRYDDPRPNRTRFMNESRARGLDIVLGIAALGIGVLFMAPLAAFSSVLMYRALRERLQDERGALLWALVYAFATPILFRSAFLNQNVILAHCVLGAWLCLTGFGGRGMDEVQQRTPRIPSGRRLSLCGLLLGTGLLCDYSAAPFLLVFGAWILSAGWRKGGMPEALRSIAYYSAGVTVPVAVLLGYQWAAFGNPVFPAQRYMPPTEYSARGWLGFSMPTVELLWGNLFDPRYGLLAYCPLLAAAFAAPLMRKREEGPSDSELAWIFASVGGLYLFSSANQFANLQWNTGVRYMVPATPLLFLAALPVLRRIPRPLTIALVGVSLLISLAVTMTREDIPRALALLMRDGPTLPILIVLKKMASGYGSLAMPGYAIWVLYLVVAILLYLMWRGTRVDSAREPA